MPHLLKKTLIALAACAVVVAACYFYVDRPVAFYVHSHHLNKIHAFELLTLPPPLVQDWSPLVIAMLVIWRVYSPLPHFARMVLVASLSLIVADQFRESCGNLCDRDWPETWHDDNPSLIASGAYGFHPLKFEKDAGSFPSGHATRILAFLTVFWIGAPRGRLLYVAVAAPMLASLVLMNYHFVSDVVAGSTLGGIVGAYAAWLGGLSGDRSQRD